MVKKKKEKIYRGNIGKGKKLIDRDHSLKIIFRSKC